MLSLKETARAFDDQVFSDVHGVGDDFMGKLLPFADSTRSGPSVQRRILDTSSDTVIPDEREIVSGGLTFVVASGNTDFFNNEKIRTKYTVLPVPGTFYIRTIAQVLAGSGGIDSAYVDPMYIRRTIFDDQSEYGGGYIIYGSSYYYMASGVIVGDGVKFFVVRENSRIDEAGFGAAEATELDDPIKTVDVTVASGAYDPVTDTYSKTTIPNVAVFQEHYSLNFENTAMGFTDIEPGDKAVSILKSAIPIISGNDTVGNFVVKSVCDRGDFWTIHARPKAG